MFTLGRMIGFSVVGFIGQMFLFFAAEAHSEWLKGLFLTAYWPWAGVFEYLAPSGPAGHAMPLGALFGFLVGLIVYSGILATLACWIIGRLSEESAYEHPGLR